MLRDARILAVYSDPKEAGESLCFVFNFAVVMLLICGILAVQRNPKEAGKASPFCLVIWHV